MTAARVFFAAGCLGLGQVFGVWAHPDPWASLAAALVALGAAAVLYAAELHAADRRPPC